MSSSTTHFPSFLSIALGLALFAGCADGDGADAGEGEAPRAGPLHRPAEQNRTAPDSFDVRFRTSAGDFRVRVERALAPLGADRVYNLVEIGYYDGVRFVRVLDGYVAQFGMHGDPEINARWAAAPILDDPVAASNVRGAVSFAAAGPDTRTTQLFINFQDNVRLDSMGFAPVGRVVEGMEVVDSLHSGYGDYAPRGAGPIAQNVRARGNAYLDEDFPELDRILSATVVAPSAG